ncbi:flagellar hook-basal body protein [Nitrospinota bacterium]
MEPGSYAIVSASMLQQRRLELLANNLAQVNTTGYKSDVPVFRIDVNRATEGQDLSLGPDIVQQSAWKFTHVNYSQGSFSQTSNPLDMALNGDGFFVLRSPDGLRYTRAGQFSLSSDGTIISPQGWPLLSTGDDPIQLPNASAVSGGIYVNQSGQVFSNGQIVGQIKIADFPKPYLLDKRGFASFSPVDPGVDITTPANTQVFQGYVEESNVNPISEMVKLIEVARLYEAYQKAIQSFDSIDDRAVNDLGRVEEIR